MQDASFRPITLFFALLFSLQSGCTLSPGTNNNQQDPGEDNPGESARLKGVVQKGPFVQGSSVTIQELSDNFVPTGTSYLTETNDDFGAFDIESPIGSDYVEIITEGYYFNENKGALSDGEITVRVLVKVEDSAEANINILTTLERERIKVLLENASEETPMTFDEARTQAEKEILEVFHIDSSTLDKNFSEMDISEGGESNAVLLAVSAILLGDNSPAELSELISKITTDIKEDGSLDNADRIAELKANAQALDLEAVRTNLQERYNDLGLSIDIPEFEDFVDSDGDGVRNGPDYNLLEPIGTITNTLPSLDWSDAEIEGIKYKVQVASDEAFDTIVEEQEDLSASTYQLSTVLAETTYYWRVLLQSGETETNTGGVKSFNVDLGTVTSTGPTNASTINDTKPTFTWGTSDLPSVTYR
ncbi:MAG: hypothetical protein QGI45_04050, partial [Myxococcota bacterium]|nr:hypothetical protein [Myxococcota bacterium]